MKFPLLLALLVGGASALHLRSETSDFKSSPRDENLPRDVELSRPEVEECPPGEELIPLEEEEGSGDEGAVSGQDMTDEDLQCPRAEDTMSLPGNPGCKTCRFLLSVCQRCYRGTLASIHSFSVNFQIYSTVRGFNQGQVWIGGRIVGWGRCKRFQWVDGSSWNFAYWAAGQPRPGGGRCVTLCTQGGHWRRSHCAQRRPFICSIRTDSVCSPQPLRVETTEPHKKLCWTQKRTVVRTKAELPPLQDQVDMKQPLILSLLLLGTMSAFHLETTHPHLENPKKEPDLWQDSGDSRDQGGDLVLTQETKTMQTEGEEADGAEHQDTFEDEESDPDALDKDSTCPSKEDTAHLQGTPGCKSCHYVLVRTPRTFYKAQSVCRRCYRGNLASIHSYSFNFQIQSLARKINQSHIWIGGILRGWFFWKKFRWTDGSCWDFGYWAPGQPGNGGGHCVTLCSTGGHWRRASCKSRLPFICSF
ncbi:proteoglycan 3-like protein [Cricetulus griseus]|nr:proteoglycan 3-like protein [Cricetulus griseus]